MSAGALASAMRAPIGVAGTDHVAVGRDDRYTMHIYNDAGSLIRIVRVLREPQPITSAEAEVLMAYDPPILELPREAGVAEHRPVMHPSVRFGDGDDLWIPDFRFAPLTGADQPSRTTIIGIDGSPVARLEIPPNPLYRGQRVGSDAGSSRESHRVVARDSLGVQRLLVFPIEKGP